MQISVKLVLLVVAVALCDTVLANKHGRSGKAIHDPLPNTFELSAGMKPEREFCFACTLLVSVLNQRGLNVNGTAQDFLTKYCDLSKPTRAPKMRQLICALSPDLMNLLDADNIDPSLAPEAICARAKACEGAAAWWDKDSNLGQIAAGVAPDKVTGPLVDVIKRGSGVKNSWEVTFTFSSGFSAVPNVVTNPQWDDSIPYPESLCVMAATYFHTCSDNINSAYYVQYLAVGPS